MYAAVLTTFLFALSSVSSARAARMIGPIRATVARLSIAALVLAAYAFSWGQGFGGPGLRDFMFSGLIGIGIGDIALFQAYHRLGARMAILLAQCLAVPFAAAMEWGWLGTQLERQIPWMIVVLVGILLALLPGGKGAATRAGSRTGIAFGIVAALGQAGGAVLSRKAILMNATAHVQVGAATASFQRIVAGMALSALVLWLLKLQGNDNRKPREAPLSNSQRSWVFPVCLANAIFGPILGFSCYQWALTAAPSGVVLAIVATTPIVVLPLAWVLEGDRPTALSIAGSVLAIGGVIGLLVG